MEVPKWLDDLIWCGKAIDPAKIEWPEDPPGVIGPNTLRNWRRLLAPHNAMNKYTPIEIEFSPSDWQVVKRYIEERSEPAGTNGAPLLGMRLGESHLLPRGFVLLRYAGGRFELARLSTGPKPSPPSMGDIINRNFPT